MKLLITGGSGFIGRNLVEKLSLKYDVSAPRHQELDLLDEDKVEAYFKNNSFDVVIHCAVRPGHRNANDSSGQLYNNTRMFFNLARNKGKFRKMIVLSSGLVYDIRHYEPKIKEEYFDTHVPIDEGGFSKYIIAKYIENVDNIVELRIFGVFGKYEDYAIRFISNAICKTLFDLPITIRQNKKFDYICIEDLMPIMEHFIDHEVKFKAYNVTPNESIELLVLAEIVKAISKKDLQIKISREGMGVEYSGDNARLREEIKSLRFTALEKAITDLLNWYKENPRLINKNNLLFDK